MPVERYRSLDDARRALWTRRPDPSLIPRIRHLWAFSRRLAPGPAPRGLRKFRTREDADAEREAWCARRALSLRAARKRP